MMTVQNTFSIAVGFCNVGVAHKLNIFRPRRFLI
jgi:hypothetical protein